MSRLADQIENRPEPMKLMKRPMTTLAALLLTLGVLTVTGAAAASPTPSNAAVATVPAMPGAEALPAAPVAIDLCASNGSITLADSTTVPVWGFVVSASCGDGMISDANFPPAPLRFNVGDTVTINLTNQLDEPVSLLIPGQPMVNTVEGPGQFAPDAAANGGMASYVFTARQGTYLYQSGSNAGIQIPMGLYGALIVDPSTTQAYSGVAGSAYDTESILVLSEIDPALNNNPAGFDLLDYDPTYHLVNGRSHPQIPDIVADPGDRVLFRYLNAGFDNPSMALLGAYQRVVARQGYPLPNAFDAVAEIVPAGATADVVVDTTGLAGVIPVHNRNGYLTNGDAFPGGMLTMLDLGGAGVSPTVTVNAPAQGSTVYGDTVSVSIDATDPVDAAGSLTVEWSVDGGLTWQTALSTTGTTYEATWDTTTGPDGLVTLQARATNSATNQSTDSVSITVSNVPVVTITSPATNQVIYGDAVIVNVSASDAEDGSLNAEWRISGGATWSPSGTALDTTALADGPVTIEARATDLRGNTGTDSNIPVVSNQPTGGITAPADGATVSGQVSIIVEASDAEDPAGSLTVLWDVDGGTSAPVPYSAANGDYRVTWDTGSLTGAHTVNVSITDSRGNQVTDSAGVTVGPGNQIHIGDLDATATAGGGPNWTATATVTIHDGNHVGNQGVTVVLTATRVAKSNGAPNVTTYTCTTDVAGRCSVSRSVNANQFENDVVFNVVSVSGPAPYSPGDNHDPDGNSPVTITIGQP